MNVFFADWRALMGALLHWLNGGDPYGPYTRPDGVFYEAGYFAYPPPALLLGAPLATLPWWLSGLLVQGVAILAFECWARRATGRSAIAWLFLWPPLFQGLQIGQTTLLALAALALAELDYSERRDVRAGLLLGLALLKPQVGALAIAYLLVIGMRQGRWKLLGAFLATTATLWGGVILVAGPQIYAQWLAGLGAYRAALPDRPMIFPPLGPLVALLAALLWRRSGRDYFGLALLVNTLLYPLSVLYIVSAVAVVVMRWRRDWQIWPLALGWVVPPLFTRLPPSAEAHIAAIQSVLALGLLVGLLPTVRLLRQDRAVAARLHSDSRNDPA